MQITPERVRAAFLATARAIDVPQSVRLAGQVACFGDLGRAIAAAEIDGSSAALERLLELRAALEEEADPRLGARRLRRTADGLDARAERLLAGAAELFGRAAYRRGQAEAGLAAELEGRAQACEAEAGRLSDEAFERRLQAAGLERRRVCCGELAQVIAA